MKVDAIRKKLKDSEKLLKSDFAVKKIGVFGSYSRGEERKNSDIDILVEFFEEPSFFKFLDLENYLTDILQNKVDLVMKNALKPNIGKHILNEVIYV